MSDRGLPERGRHGNAGPASESGPEAGLSLHLMGAFRVRRHGVTLALPGSSRRVLAYVAQTDVATRRELAGNLWPDLRATRAGADLRTALWHLQKADPRLVTVVHDLVSLGDSVHVDLRAIEVWISDVLRAAHGDDRPPSPPVGLGAVLLPDWDDEWLEQPRERLRMLQIQASETAASRLLASGHPGEALSYVLPIVQSDPLRESANQLLIEIHLQQGNAAEAYRHYERYRAALLDELGIEPGAALTSTVAELLKRPAFGGKPPRP